MENLNETIGFRITTLRNYYKLSQGEFAKKIGSSQRAVSSWESGDILVPTRFIYIICDVFSLPMDYFDIKKNSLETLLQNSHQS